MGPLRPLEALHKSIATRVNHCGPREGWLVQLIQRILKALPAKKVMGATSPKASLRLGQAGHFNTKGFNSLLYLR